MSSQGSVCKYANNKLAFRLAVSFPLLNTLFACASHLLWLHLCCPLQCQARKQTWWEHRIQRRGRGATKTAALSLVQDGSRRLCLGKCPSAGRQGYRPLPSLSSVLPPPAQILLTWTPSPPASSRSVYLLLSVRIYSIFLS